MKVKVPIILACAILLTGVISAFGFTALNDGRTTSAAGYSFGYEAAPAERSFTIFVGGAANEDYYTVPVGITYGELFAVSGFRNITGYDLSEKINPLSVSVFLSGDCCNINAADADEMASYIGSGSIAAAIYDYIAVNGPADSKYELIAVLGEAVVEQIKDSIYAYK